MPEPDPVLPGPDVVLSVAELNRAARQVLERGFPLLWVAGEVSNLARAASGHVYFSLKDAAAQVRCVMFRHRAQLLPWRLDNGARVEARALVTLYEPRGDFQLTVEALRHAGLGALYEAFARLRERLGAEGLFDEAGKRPLPALPRTVGVVSSLQAAALQDVLAALRRRCPHVAVVIYPVPVQGADAARQMAARLLEAGTRGECEVLILARGGGSIEDLWAFNEEAVARALRTCLLPVVCGVGHETDVTIADLASDRRAATPTAAAELVSAGWMEVAAHLPQLSRRLLTA
ncbi:MAG: exodeoxyribonuclease VII large subunit, partial [Betaproteobacteria bacterium]|nr:exodeoxyribonuclease VII large subunit [Betaproteobacteria bacterium]